MFVLKPHFQWTVPTWLMPTTKYDRNRAADFGLPKAFQNLPSTARQPKNLLPKLLLSLYSSLGVRLASWTNGTPILISRPTVTHTAVSLNKILASLILNLFLRGPRLIQNSRQRTQHESTPRGMKIMRWYEHSREWYMPRTSGKMWIQRERELGQSEKSCMPN